MKPSAAKSGKYAKIATRPVPPSLPPNCRSHAGTSRLAIPPSLTASSTVWCTTPTASKCAASPCARNVIRHRTRRRNEPKPVSVSYDTNFPGATSGQVGDPTPDDSRSPLQALRREVAGDVENQLRDARRISIDLPIGAGHDGHVGRDRPVQRVQGRNQRLGGAVGPQRQIA